tara:strand:- start:2765 stop:2920 length:156 start_codon:yes stop_codon:yes gene_type:complete
LHGLIFPGEEESILEKYENLSLENQNCKIRGTDKGEGDISEKVLERFPENS